MRRDLSKHPEIPQEPARIHLGQERLRGHRTVRRPAKVMLADRSEWDAALVGYARDKDVLVLSGPGLAPSI